MLILLYYQFKKEKTIVPYLGDLKIPYQNFLCFPEEYNELTKKLFMFDNLRLNIT